MNDTFKYDIPKPQPYEGKASRKQKRLIWELGFRDTTIIDSLGRAQASALIEQLIAHGRKREGVFSARRVLFLGSILFLICVGSCHHAAQNSETAALFGFIAIICGIAIFIAVVRLLFAKIL
jgi:hypothetical protein